jgi:putative NADH-flavin reductase
MRLTIVAATGGIGRQLVSQALAAGHEVTALARAPRDLPPGIRVVRADLTGADTAAVEEAVHGADAVLSGLGPSTRAAAGVAATGTSRVADAMWAVAVKRLVVVSAAPVGLVATPHRPRPPRHDPGDGFVMRHLMAPLILRALRPVYDDLALMEDNLRETGLDWTVVRPPRLTDKPLTGRYRVAYGQNVRGGAFISRADVAHLMLSALDRPDTIHQTLGIAN